MVESRQKTMQDVADLAQVSTATVSRVINRSGHVSPATEARVQAALKHLGYIPNAWAQAMATDGPLLIGLIVPNMLDPFFSAIYAGMNSVIRKTGIGVWVMDSANDSNQEQMAIHMLQRYRAKGIVIAPTQTHMDFAQIEVFSTPICVVDRRPDHNHWDLVVIDNLNGARRATQLLIDAGHTQIAIITGPQTTTPGVERYYGFMEAMTQAQLPVVPDYVKFGDFHQNSGYHLGKDLLTLPCPPTAIFSCNNLMTMGLLQAIHATQGAELGQTVAVIGFDDIPISTLITPSLTVVSQPVEEMGKQAAKLLLSRIATPTKKQETIVLPPELIVRGSETLVGPVL